MSKDKETVATQEFTVLGKPVIYDPAKNQFTMSRNDYDEALAELGATKEVRKVVIDAVDTVSAAVLPLMKDKVIETKVPQLAKLGQGNDSAEIKMKGEVISEGKTPGTGKEYRSVKYGQTSITINRNFNRELRKEGGLLAQCAAEIEAAFKKK